jgi:hypothetical protein
VAVFGRSQFGLDAVFFEDELVFLTAAFFAGMVEGVFKISCLAGHNRSAPQGEAVNFFVTVAVHAALTQGIGPDVAVRDKNFGDGGGEQVGNAPDIGVNQICRGFS